MVVVKGFAADCMDCCIWIYEQNQCSTIKKSWQSLC